MQEKSMSRVPGLPKSVVMKPSQKVFVPSVAVNLCSGKDSMGGSTVVLTIQNVNTR